MYIICVVSENNRNKKNLKCISANGTWWSIMSTDI